MEKKKYRRTDATGQLLTLHRADNLEFRSRFLRIRAYDPVIENIPHHSSSISVTIIRPHRPTHYGISVQIQTRTFSRWIKFLREEEGEKKQEEIEYKTKLCTVENKAIAMQRLAVARKRGNNQ